MKLAFQQGWLDDEQRWLTILDDRNLTSHTYNDVTAGKIYGRLRGHLTVLRELLVALKAL